MVELLLTYSIFRPRSSKPILTDHPKPESLTTKQIMRYSFKGCDRIHCILDTYKYKNTGVGWSVKIGTF